jgi:hypothetical protein
MQAPPEQLGSFYLGAVYDLESGKRTETPVSYDARDLVTHAVCVGMTGSGKTGLCIGLLEEAAIDKVPAILIDPKGDITNLLLQFPDLRPEDFQPWINADDARRKGKTVEEFATSTAETWGNGLADWGIGGEQMRLLAQHTKYTIFTPGSEMGTPLNIMGSLAAPKLDWETESEAILERIGGTVAALLGLAGVNADPVRSREGILLANIFEHAWRKGEDLDLEKLINQITTPPVKKLGAFEVDTFYPPKDRFNLAMSFNTLLASPKFQVWLQGEPLDVDKLYFTADGNAAPQHHLHRPPQRQRAHVHRHAAAGEPDHLDAQTERHDEPARAALLRRDFRLLPAHRRAILQAPAADAAQTGARLWAGRRAGDAESGRHRLQGADQRRHVVYRQAASRARQGAGAGRSQGRALRGGQGEATDYSTLITRLGNRVFLMHNVNDDGPVVFHTRWALSYLRGPLTCRRCARWWENRRPPARPQQRRPQRRCQRRRPLCL